MSVQRACDLVALPRATYYRPPSAHQEAKQDQAVNELIEEIVLEFPGYGYRRVTPELRRRGRLVNHKRVRRLMGEQGLCCRQRRRWQRTTDSRHGLRVYPNRLADCGWRRLTGVDQAWVADITYLRLPQGFAY
ncbi:MAG: transposase, partial [Chloroflexi bacterium]|nr:transposase [Chloroflexota bacterium]